MSLSAVRAESKHTSAAQFGPRSLRLEFWSSSFDLDELVDPHSNASRTRAVCIVYDCLYPYTVGGAERWYRNLADALRSSGAPVEYLTRRQWELPDEQLPERFRVVAVTGAMNLYDKQGRRRTGPTLRFGYGVLKHLVRNRSRYRIVHVANFPFFSFLAVRLALIGTDTRVFVDWHEVWTKTFWLSYGGRLLGTVGFVVERLCIRLSRHAYVFSEQNGNMLCDAGLRSRPIILAGLLPTLKSDPSRSEDAPAVPPTVVFAGRHIADKGIDLVPAAFGHARQLLPDLRLVITGDGPLRNSVESEVSALGLTDCVRFAGFVGDEEFRRILAEAACLLLPSRREGYGMIVAEATAVGTPVVVAAHPQNNATHLVENGVNGFVVEQPTSASLADGVVRAVQQGRALRRSTAAWSKEHHSMMTMERSLSRVLADYSRLD